MSEKKTDCPECLARARSDTVIVEANAMLIKCMRGKIDPRTADVQRKAALDILSKDYLRHMSDEDLLAEVDSRAKRPG